MSLGYFIMATFKLVKPGGLLGWDPECLQVTFGGLLGRA